MEAELIIQKTAVSVFLKALSQTIPRQTMVVQSTILETRRSRRLRFYSTGSTRTTMTLPAGQSRTSEPASLKLAQATSWETLPSRPAHSTTATT